MPRYCFTIEYHGGPFVGWQRQSNGRSVQQVLEEALAALDPGAPTVTGAGRTDAGVHARGQVAHADLTKSWEPARLMGALNWHLAPEPIAVLSVAEVGDDFHARFSAIRRRYLYRVICRRAPLAIERGLAWRVPVELEVAAMREAARALIGRHDFTTFRASGCQARSPVKTLDELAIGEFGSELRFHFAARSFLHNQVRSMVGTLVEVGRGRWPAARVAAALAARDRRACGPVAPPEGLYLMSVDYP